MSWLPLCVLAAALAQATPAEIPEETIRDRVQWLADHAVPIRSIDPDDRALDDLEPLRARIGSARVVVLGEICHSDGATFRARCRLIRFLHERMGFDVIAWEAGLLDCRRMSEALRATDVPLTQAAQHMMRGGWDASAEVRPLFEYVRESWRTPAPIEMTGFDSNRPPHGREHLDALLDGLLAQAPELLPDAADVARVRSVFQRAAAFFSAEHGKIAPDQRAAERASLEKLVAACEAQRDRLREALSPREAAFTTQILGATLVHEEAQWLMGKRLITGEVADAQRWNDLRDREMARQFLWLVDDYYRDRKIIVLAATAHLTRNTSTIEGLEPGMSYAGVSQMGDHVHARLGADLYTIAFTAYQGEVGLVAAAGNEKDSRVNPISRAPPPAGSLEDLCHRIEEPYALIDLRATPAGHWLREPMIAWPMGFCRNRANWSQIIDAFFFIDEMTPDRRWAERPGGG